MAIDIVNPSGFINTDKISIREFIGKKIILVDFWTFSCINCQRTLPYLVEWDKKYKDKGLQIIGIHTPEFEFEKKYENVKKAVEHYGITYPVVLDNDFGTWNAFGNRYWPRKYVIDKNGFVVYDHAGEGEYTETEKKIQELLGIEEDVVNLNFEAPHGREISPEIYFGAKRNSYLVPGFNEPKGIKTNILYLVGKWDIKDEYAENKESGAKIIFRFKGKNVFMVAGSEKEVKVKILIDEKEYKELIIKNHDLYKMYEGEEYGEHTLEIIPENLGLQAFTFTFG